VIGAVVDGAHETVPPEARMNGEFPSEPPSLGIPRLRYAPLILMIAAGTGLSLAIFAALRRWEWRQIEMWQSWIVLAMGLLATAVVGAIFLATVNRADRDERMLVERATELERSREHYRSLVENIDQGIALIDRNFNIVTINASQARMFGKPPEYFLGKKCHREFEKRDAPCAHCPGARAMVTRRPCVTGWSRTSANAGKRRRHCAIRKPCCATSSRPFPTC
jgi:PAS domain-containing protein